MKKMISLICGIMMVCACSVAYMPVQAVSHTFESTQTDEWYNALLDNEMVQWYQDADGVIYCAEDGIDATFDPYIPNPGTFDRSDILLALMRKYPDSLFAVQLDSWCGEDSVGMRERENWYLQENGIEFYTAKEGVCVTKYAVLNTKQLEDFPVYENVGYLIRLAKKSDIGGFANEKSIQPDIESIFVLSGDINSDGEVELVDAIYLQKYLLNEAALDSKQWKAADLNHDESVDVFDLGLLKRTLIHTFEDSRTDEWYDEFLENEREQWYQSNDGVFYCSDEGIGMTFDPYIPNPGTCDRSQLLLALMHKYPDSQFAVQLNSWCDDDSPDTRHKERAYLNENGIAFQIGSEGVCEIKYAVLNVDQLENFPVYEKAGYLIGLAKKDRYVQ